MASILIIDDEEQVRVLLRHALEGAGYDVADARNGQEGLRQFRQAPPDLVITDILMPDMDGLEFIMDLRLEFPRVKLIALSAGTGDKNFLPVAKLLGASRTLAKPVTVQDLLQAVQRELQRSGDDRG